MDAPAALRHPPAALSQPDFRALWLAGLISDAGDWMLLVALPIVVYARTGSALGTSGAFLAQLAPGMVLAPLAGRLADRVDRPSLMLVLTLLQALTLAPLLLVGGRSGLAIVYAVIVVQASLTALFDPAKNALLPTLVGLDQLVSANSLVGLGAAAGRLAGGPLGGLLLAAGDLRTIVVVDAASFLLAAGLITRVARRRTPVRARPATPPPTPGAVRGAGFLAALHHRHVRGALLVAFCAQIAQGIFVVLFIVFVARRLGGGPGEIGLLRGVQAVGAIAAGLALAGTRHWLRPAVLIAAASAVFGVISLTVWNLPLATTAEAVYVILFVLVGAPGVAFETGLLSLLARAAAPGERGRVMSAAALSENGGQAVGMLAAGWLTGPLGLGAMLDLQGALYVAAGVLAALVLSDRGARGRLWARHRPRRAQRA